ncbi:hypothetical protein E2C01_044289 [Portunus trituberculatus]|uniref:Uncharacterized protein n=1 Tax=Portunus trituberculatus TaxID=210409 RepID=A0A5B7FRQ8_PORTR|nr:hypothetical protein [Portunus trituberculatus]
MHRWKGGRDSGKTVRKKGSTVTTISKERAQLLASLFAGKMKVGNPQQLPPQSTVPAVRKDCHHGGGDA